MEIGFDLGEQNQKKSGKVIPFGRKNNGETLCTSHFAVEQMTIDLVEKNDNQEVESTSFVTQDILDTLDNKDYERNLIYHCLNIIRSKDPSEVMNMEGVKGYLSYLESEIEDIKKQLRK